VKRGGPLKRRRTAFNSGPRKPLPATSAKTKDRDRQYAKEREEYLSSHGRCEHGFAKICETWSNQIDHRIPRGLAPHRVTDRTNFIASCSPCHDYRTNRMTRIERQKLKLGIYADDYRDNK